MQRLLFLVVLVCSIPALAFSPGPQPSLRVVTDPSKTLEIEVQAVEKWQCRFRVLTAEGAAEWSPDLGTPRMFLVSKAESRVLALGAYGDGWGAEGRINIYDLQGTLVQTVDLAAHIPDMKNRVETYTPICCPALWLHAAWLSDDQKTLVVNLFDQLTARVTVATGAVTIEPQPTPAPAP